MDNQKIQQLDKELILASKDIKVLSTLSWPADAEGKFIKGWHKGNPQLPELNVVQPDLNESVKALDEIVKKCRQEDPVEKFIAETALSYSNAGRMLMNVGTTDFTKYACKIYGRPDTKYKLQDFTGIESAKFFLELTDKLLGNLYIQSTPLDISSDDFALSLKGLIDEFFVHDKVNVITDSNMSSKALAGATRIRIRDGAMFSQLDKDQLLQHEAFVHSATQLNGRKQPNLQSLRLGAPRTTRTQEGIAILAELVTNAIDLTRLRRIALRVIAVKMALDGADFIDVFKFFLEEGQSEEESVRSAQRIFRGGEVKGGVVFTKDAVYLQGLIEVQTFFRVAIRDNRPELVSNLFAGRLTMADALRLDPLFQNGWLVPPTYIPLWAADLRRLAAMMAYSAFISNVNLEKVYLERVVEIEEEHYLANL